MHGIGRTIGMLVLGALLGILGLYGWWTLSGYTVRVEPKGGTLTGAVLRFGDDARATTLPANLAAISEPETTEDLAATPAAPRNVILLIADGMGFAHVAGARAALAGVDSRLFIEQFPVAGWLTTHAHKSLITDSAASAAAMATGHKTAYGQLAQTAEGVAMRTIAEAGRDAGMAIGLITDSYLWDATPAAFVAHAARRDFEVVSQMAGSGFEVLLGERHPDMDEATLAKIQGEFISAGRTVVADPAGWVAGLGEIEPAVGLLDPGTIADPEQPPHLVDLTSEALQRLATGGDGFFLLVETEETDTGSHDWDFDRVTAGVASLDAVAKTAVGFAEQDGATLVLVTADHETGGLTLIGGEEGEALRVRWATRSHSAVPVPLFAFGPGAERFAGPHDNTEVATIVAELLGLGL